MAHVAESEASKAALAELSETPFRADAHLDTHDTHEAPPPDEPKTPLWLTALGGCLFFLLAVIGLAGLASDSGESEAPAAAASASAAPVASPKPTPVAAPPPPPPPAPVAPPSASAPQKNGKKAPAKGSVGSGAVTKPDKP